MRLTFGVRPIRPVVRKLFAMVCSLRLVALRRPPCSSLLKPVPETKDQQVVADPRRLTVPEPPPFTPQFFDAEDAKTLKLGLDAARSQDGGDILVTPPCGLVCPYASVRLLPP